MTATVTYINGAIPHQNDAIYNDSSASPCPYPYNPYNPVPYYDPPATVTPYTFVNWPKCEHCYCEDDAKLDHAKCCKCSDTMAKKFLPVRD